MHQLLGWTACAVLAAAGVDAIQLRHAQSRAGIDDIVAQAQQQLAALRGYTRGEQSEAARESEAVTEAKQEAKVENVDEMLLRMNELKQQMAVQAAPDGNPAKSLRLFEAYTKLKLEATAVIDNMKVTPEGGGEIVDQTQYPAANANPNVSEGTLSGDTAPNAVDEYVTETGPKNKKELSASQKATNAAVEAGAPWGYPGDGTWHGYYPPYGPIAVPTLSVISHRGPLYRRDNLLSMSAPPLNPPPAPPAAPQMPPVEDSNVEYTNAMDDRTLVQVNNVNVNRAPQETALDSFLRDPRNPGNSEPAPAQPQQRMGFGPLPPGFLGGQLTSTAGVGGINVPGATFVGGGEVGENGSPVGVVLNQQVFSRQDTLPYQGTEVDVVGEADAQEKPIEGASRAVMERAHTPASNGASNSEAMAPPPPPPPASSEPAPATAAPAPAEAAPAVAPAPAEAAPATAAAPASTTPEPVAAAAVIQRGFSLHPHRH